MSRGNMRQVFRTSAFIDTVNMSLTSLDTSHWFEAVPSTSSEKMGQSTASSASDKRKKFRRHTDSLEIVNTAATFRSKPRSEYDTCKEEEEEETADELFISVERLEDAEAENEEEENEEEEEIAKKVALSLWGRVKCDVVIRKSSLETPELEPEMPYLPVRRPSVHFLPEASLIAGNSKNDVLGQHVTARLARCTERNGDENEEENLEKESGKAKERAEEADADEEEEESVMKAVSRWRKVKCDLPMIHSINRSPLHSPDRLSPAPSGQLARRRSVTFHCTTDDEERATKELHANPSHGNRVLADGNSTEGNSAQQKPVSVTTGDAEGMGRTAGRILSGWLGVSNSTLKSAFRKPKNAQSKDPEAIRRKSVSFNRGEPEVPAEEAGSSGIPPDVLRRLQLIAEKSAEMENND